MNKKASNEKNDLHTFYTPYSADNDEIDFGQQLRVIWTNKYKILAALLAGGILGAAFSLASTPQYRADAMLEIETRQNQILTEINSIFNNQTTPSEAEVKLVQSRLVLGKTVDDLQLDQEVKAKYTPVIGSLMHNISGDPDPKLTVGSFTVQDEWFNKTFTLTAKSNKAYTLTLPDKHVVEGKVGVPLKINNQTTLKIDQILANPGQEFALTKFSRISAIENIQNKLAVISKGKTSPIINLTFTDTDPKRTSVILNSIADNYVAQNRERDVQVASSGLAFISEELPRLKETLQDAENKLNAYRQQSGSLDIPLESKGALESLTGIETQITLLKTEEAGLAELYTPEHPSYKAVLDKLAVLERAKNKINQQIAELPNTQQEVIRLTRDVETNQATYVQLLSKQQELNIMKASAQGNVRIVDYAYVPENPVAPAQSRHHTPERTCRRLIDRFVADDSQPHEKRHYFIRRNRKPQFGSRRSCSALQNPAKTRLLQKQIQENRRPFQLSAGQRRPRRHGRRSHPHPAHQYLLLHAGRT